MQLDPAAFVAAPELLQALSEIAAPVDCSVDRELFRQGDPATGLFILHGGEAAMTLEDQDGSVLATASGLLPGSILGLPATIMDAPYSMTAIAKAGSEVEFIGRNLFSALMSSNTSLALVALRVMAAEVQGMRSAMASTLTPHGRN